MYLLKRNTDSKICLEPRITEKHNPLHKSELKEANQDSGKGLMIPSLKTPKKMSYRHAFRPIWWKQFLTEVLLSGKSDLC